MTQFLLIQSRTAPDLPAGYAATEVAAVFTNHQSITDLVFGKWETLTWKVSPEADEIDSLLHDAQDTLSRGAAMADSALGTLLQALLHMPCEALAMFYADFVDDLPVVRSGSELLETVQDQLNTEYAPEVYVLWRNPNSIKSA